MSSALGMNLMPPTSAFQHAGGSATLQKPDEQDSNSATEVTKDNIEEVQEKGKIRESHFTYHSLKLQLQNCAKISLVP